MQIKKEKIEAFIDFIEKHEHFMVSGHKEPDADALCSCLGVKAIIEHFEKDCILLSCGPFKRREIKKYEKLFEREIPFSAKTQKKDWGFIIVDCNEIHRTGELDGNVKDFDIFVIDHHANKADKAINEAQTIIEPTVPAATAIVALLYEKLVGKIPEGLSADFFLGVAADTGFFKHLTQKDSLIFELASRLVNSGANPKQIYSDLTGGKSWETRQLLGIMLSRAKRCLDGRLVITYETMSDTKRYAKEGRDSDALYSLFLSVEGVKAVVFIRQESQTNCTLGFRSIDDIDVNEIAQKFGGGGHKNAAGASTPGEIDTLIPSIIKEFARIIK